MKVGILTFHRSFNYGAFLQCYSLSSRLKKEFPTVDFEVVDYTPQKVFDSYAKSHEKQKDQNIREALFALDKGFIPCQNTLPLSKPQLITDDQAQAAAYLNERYDAVIVGSDAVWNWNVRGFPNVYFLKDYHGRKFSYAASAHGLIYQNATAEQKDYLRQAFDDFSFIGVRDATTADMVHSVLPEKEVIHNCDPTVFLPLEIVPCDMQALRQKMERHGVDFSKPLIGLMAGESIGAEIKHHYADHIQLIGLYSPNRYADVFLNDLTPFEFAHVFSFFKLTLTHFFHGTLLSLKNGTSVIPVETMNAFSAVNETKIKDLLTRLALLEWREEIDHHGKGKLWRAVDRVVHIADRDIWNRVIARMDDFMASDYSELITQRLNTEAKAFQPFYEVFSNTIVKKDTNG